MPQLTTPIRQRTQRWLPLLLLVSAFVPSIASSHPLKMSASLIEYDTAKKSMRMECKVFIDDFERSLMNSVMKGLDPAQVSKKQRVRLIELYFQKFYSIKHNGRRVPLKFKSVTPLYRANVLVIQFSDVALALKQGDKLVINNTMFFADFGLAQTNRIAVRIPLFKIDDGHAGTVRNHVFSYTLGAVKK